MSTTNSKFERSRYERAARTMFPSDTGLLAPLEIGRHSAEYRRRLFFAFVSKLNPVVLSSLREGPYAELEKCHLPPGVLLFDVGRAEHDERFKRLLSSLRLWGRRSNLNDKWCLEAALRTITHWHSIPASSGWSHDMSDKAIEFSQPPSPNHDPTLESLSEYVFRRRQFEEDYRRRFRDEVEAAHLIEVPERRQLGHFAWLAGYQTRGWYKNQIAEAAGVHFYAVHNALRTLSEQIDLTLRTEKRSAPRWPMRNPAVTEVQDALYRLGMKKAATHTR